MSHDTLGDSTTLGRDGAGQGCSQGISFRHTTQKEISVARGLSCPPSPLGRGAGGGFGRTRGDDLAVHRAQEQHQPERPEHLGRRDVMWTRDAKKQYCRES